MTSPSRPFAPNEDEVAAILRRLAEAPSRTYEATADGVVRVRVDGAMRVVDIEVLDAKADPHAKAALEAAAAAAVNLALQKAALAAGDVVAALDHSAGGERTGR